MTARYNLKKMDGKARRGSFRARSGTFETPTFMPVGTRASVKGVDVQRLEELGASVMLVNTYHLWLRPGHERIKRLGGIHAFTGWHGPILSDSGGFQVFSLKSIRTISERGIEFRSHLDGSKQFLSPEKSIEVQQTMGVDIAMALDECPASDIDFDAFNRSLDMTVRWARRSLDARTDPELCMFGITQGGCHRELRTKSAQQIAEIPFDGYAIGGVSVGEPKASMYEVLSYHPDQLPSDHIRYLMGVGTPEDIVEAVSHGVDIFDCVMPTRSGRFGRVFVEDDPPFFNIKNSRYAEDSGPIDPTCACFACRTHSRAYIHHLFKVGEMLGPQLASIHNLTHYLSLMKRIRDTIEQGTFAALYGVIKARWKTLDLHALAE
ncbi:MAG: queuine tRNA-ribosyltransferase [Pseudomonadota bacterium]|jgi:queuine tRNA-ribosyltransferase